RFNQKEGQGNSKLNINEPKQVNPSLEQNQLPAAQSPEEQILEPNSDLEAIANDPNSPITPEDLQAIQSEIQGQPVEPGLQEGQIDPNLDQNLSGELPPQDLEGLEGEQDIGDQYIPEYARIDGNG